MITGDTDGIVVVAGTDTEVGKTTAACALLRAWRNQGRRPLGLKPVESGIASQECRADEDGRRLAAASGQTRPQEAFQRLSAPLAPPVAARDEGVDLDPDRWIRSIREIHRPGEPTLVEGAGGLLSPLARQFDTRDLAIVLEAPVLLVAADKLGSLNHTFLTLEALFVAGIEVAGVVFSAPETPDSSTGRNAEVVAERYPRFPVMSLPRIETVEEGAQVFEQSLLGAVSSQ